MHSLHPTEESDPRLALETLMDFKEMHTATQTTAAQAETTIGDSDVHLLTAVPKFQNIFNAAYNFVNRVKNALSLQTRNGDVRLHYFVRAIEAYENRHISMEDLHHDMRKIFDIYPKFLRDFERFMPGSPHYAFHDGYAHPTATIHDLDLNGVGTQHKPALSSASQHSIARARRSTPESSVYGHVAAPVRQRVHGLPLSSRRPQHRIFRPVKKPDTWHAKALAQSLGEQRQPFGAPSPKLKEEESVPLAQTSTTRENAESAKMGGLPIVHFLPSQRRPRSHNAPPAVTALTPILDSDAQSTSATPAPFSTFVAATPAELSTPPANTGTGQGTYKCPLCYASFTARHAVRYHFFGRSNVKDMRVGNRGFPHMNSAGCFNRNGQPEGVAWDSHPSCRSTRKPYKNAGIRRKIRPGQGLGLVTGE